MRWDHRDKVRKSTSSDIVSSFRTIIHLDQCVCDQTDHHFALKIAPMFGWNRFETFEFGCTVAFHDSSAVCRSYVITALVVVFVLPFGKSPFCSRGTVARPVERPSKVPDSIAVGSNPGGRKKTLVKIILSALSGKCRDKCEEWEQKDSILQTHKLWNYKVFSIWVKLPFAHYLPYHLTIKGLFQS